MVNTTIQISEQLHKMLMDKKLFDRETYEEIILDLIEDTKELSEQTKKELKEARDEIKKGKIHTISKVKKELNI